jgi:starch-binding outer membrane protein, SusD/RagB family
MKTIKIYIFIIAAIASLFFAGCSKDFLDIKPAGKIGEAAFYADTSNVDLMVSSVYGTFLYKAGFDVYDAFRFKLGSVPSDEAESGGQKPMGDPSLHAFDIFNFTSEAPVLGDVYGTMFNGVSRSSEVIEKLPELRKIASDDLKKKIDLRMAETRFLRAAFYFVLARSFGGVPVVNHILLPSEYKMPRGTIKDVYNLMEKDLKAAIPYLPLEDQIAASNKGRASKGAAQALLAKMYVYESSYFTYYGANDPRMGAVQDRWKEAYDLCQEIIASGQYELVTGKNFTTFWSNDLPGTNGFRYIFSVEGNNNKESIFAIQHIKDSGYDNYKFGESISQLSGVNRVFKKKGVKGETTIDNPRWGWWVPSNTLFNLFDANDVRRGVAIAREADSINAVPRDSILCKVDGVKGWYVVAKLPDPITGLQNFKYEIGKHNSLFETDKGFQGNPLNIYYIRYADVVLMASEAASHTVDQSGTGVSRDLFNLIRARARNCGNGIDPLDLTGAVTLKEIMDERSREFAMEGERFFDLVRWKKAQEVISKVPLDWWAAHGITDHIIYTEPKNDFFPLPAFETEKNSKLIQYEGW